MAFLRNQLLPLALVILFPPILASAQSMCPPHKPLPKGYDDLRMVEADFTIPKAFESLQWAEKDIWDVISKHKTTEELLHNTEQFGIPLPNSVSTIKGALLYQQAMLERERVEVAKLRLKAGSGSKVDLEAAQKRFEGARRKFCKFLEKAEFVD